MKTCIRSHWLIVMGMLLPAAVPAFASKEVLFEVNEGQAAKEIQYVGEFRHIPYC